jgi:fucose permease
MTSTLHEAADVVSVRGLLRRYRIAVSIMFAIAGMIIGTWTARIPEIQHHRGLSDGQLSIALLALACGGLVGMRTAGRLVDRHGTGRVMTVTSLALGAALAVTAYTPNLATLGLALLTLGALHGTLNVSMNAAASTCQTAYGRPIMASFHALFSIGGVAGAATSAGCAHAHHSGGQTFIAVGAALTGAAFVAIRPLAFAPHTEAVDEQPTSAAQPGDSRPRRRVALFGLLAFCALISEGAAADWSSVYLDRLGASPAYAAAAYAAFAGCMTVGRLTGDRITAAVNPAVLLRGSGVIAGAGLGIGILVGSPVAAVIGFACLGAGLSCVIPTLYSTAGNLDPSRPGAALSRVAALGYLGYVTGPVIIGGAAAQLGLGHALLILPVLAGVLVAAAPIVRVAHGAASPSPRDRRPLTKASA